MKRTMKILSGRRNVKLNMLQNPEARRDSLQVAELCSNCKNNCKVLTINAVIQFCPKFEEK